MRVAVLVSGTGTNLQALIDAGQSSMLGPAELVYVLSNRPNVQALERAAAAGIDASVLNHRDFTERSDFDSALVSELRARDVEAIALAGFMRILGPTILESYKHRIVNAHPALCPAFPGLAAPQQALDAGVKVTGCTVHFVDAGVDTGPIILQQAVEVCPGDTAASLHARIQRAEHRLLPQAIRLLAEGALRVSDGRVEVDS